MFLLCKLIDISLMSCTIISKHMSSLRDLSLGVSICLNMVFIESLNTYSLKSQVSTVEKLLTVTKSGLDSQEILDKTNS